MFVEVQESKRKVQNMVPFLIKGQCTVKRPVVFGPDQNVMLTFVSAVEYKEEEGMTFAM